MDLITAEIKALNKRCEQLEVNKESLNNEINLLNKLLFCEQKYVKHLNELLVFYELNLSSDDKYCYIKEINANKVVAKQNELQLNKLKQELIDWRKQNNRFHIQKADHTYSSKNSKNNEVLKTSKEKSVVKQQKNDVINRSPLDSTPTNSQTIISCDNLSILEQINTNQQKESIIPIQLEIIPKCEPLSDVETETSSETDDIQSKNNKSNSFLLVSEYLSKTKNFSHFMNNNNEKTDGKDDNVCDVNDVDKSIAIDLNKDSDQDSTQEVNKIESIFNNEIIDLTPKTSAKKSGSKWSPKTKVNVESKQLTKKKTQVKKKTNMKAKHSINKTKQETNKTVKISLSGNTFKCKWNKCSYSSELKGNIVRHYRTHTGEKPYKCNLCTKQFTQSRSLRAHSIAHNTGKKFARRSKIISDLSKKVKANNKNKKQNKRSTYGGGHLLCPISKCDRKYHEFSHLMRHLNQNHGKEKAQNFKKNYYKQKAVMINSITHRNDSIVKKNQKNLAQSIKSGPKKGPLIDVREKQWKCDYRMCERSYFDKHNLKRHQLEVHKVLSKVLFKGLKSSTNSDIKFFNPPKVSNNINDSNTSNDNNQTFVCNHNGCNNTYQTQSGLYKHQKTKHISNQIRTLVKKTVKKSNNESLRVSDTNIDTNKPSLTRDWICEIANCGSSYIHKHDLKRHMKDHHILPDDQQSNESNSSLNTPKEKYECTYESCAFFTLVKRSLIVHYKTHFESDNKPFKCLITDCNYSVNALHKLKNHVLNRHSEQEFFRAMEATGVHYPVW